MTKIPSVEEWKLRVEALHPTSFCNAHDIDEMNWEHDKKGTIEMIEEALTAEREARDQEWRDAIQRLINVSNEHSSNDWFNGLRACRSIKLPTK